MRFDCKQCQVSARQGITLTNWFKKLSRSGKERTQPATVLSHRISAASFPTMESTWNYLVTFTLSDGSKTELYATEEAYDCLKDGMSGQLTWQGENFVSFEQEG